MNVRACLRCSAVVAALFLSFGCSSKAKSPLDPASGLDTRSGLDGSHFGGLGLSPRGDITGGSRRFFPLDSGSVWVYTLEQRTEIADSSAPPDVFVDRGSVTTLMGGAYDMGGTPYVRSLETTRIRGDRDFSSVIFYRQDDTGLYELDQPIRDPSKSARAARLHDALAARIARGRPETRTASLRALANLESKVTRVEQMLNAAPMPATGPQGQPEIQRLAYPLTVGREWIVRPDPLFTERVEARDVVTVAGRRLSAWRIRIEADFLGPDDRVWLWFSREGELRFRYRLFSVATDDTGNPVGVVTAEEDQQLVSYQLAGSAPVGSAVNPHPLGGLGTSSSGAPRTLTR